MSEPQWITELKQKCETQCRIQEQRREPKLIMDIVEALNCKLIPLMDEFRKGKK